MKYQNLQDSSLSIDKLKRINENKQSKKQIRLNISIFYSNRKELYFINTNRKIIQKFNIFIKLWICL